MKYAMSDCMCERCNLVTECWNILDDDYEVITDKEVLKDISEGWDSKACLVDCSCSTCLCWNECCEKS